jgi:hypothetical protein
MNPADTTMRGITVDKLKETKEWFNGREFLTHQDDSWPEQLLDPGQDLANILPKTITGLKKTRHGNINDLLCTAATQVCLFSAAPARDDYADPLIPHLLKFSDWEKLIRIVAYCRRMASRRKGDISPLEKFESERALAFHNQRTSFRATLFQLRTHGLVNHDNVLACLDPFLDAQGIVRLAGRIEAVPVIYETNYQILLHPKDPITEVLAPFLHRKLTHSGGSRALLTEISKFYWVPRVTTLLRRVAYKCVVRSWKFAKPTHQMMAPLPFLRLPTARLHAFDHSAIDVAGPYNVVWYGMVFIQV